jgi:hypothetical protein
MAFVSDGRSRPEMAPQRLEKIESAPGIGMVSEASEPLHLVFGRAADRALRGTKAPRSETARIASDGRVAPKEAGGKFSCLQSIDKSRNRKESRQLAVRPKPPVSSRSQTLRQRRTLRSEKTGREIFLPAKH